MMKAAAMKSNKPNESRAAANTVNQKKNDPKGASGLADNRPGPAAGHLKSEPKGPPGPSKFIRLYAPSPVVMNDNKKTNPGIIQKMAVMTVNNLDNQKDPLVWNNLEYAVKQAPGPIGDLKDHKVWDKLKDNEEIRFIEHGDIKEIGKLKASDIARSMSNKPHKFNKKRQIGKVTFQSCYAGVDGGKGSLVSDMTSELDKLGQKNVPVVGRTGIAFGFKGMGEATGETDTGEKIKGTGKKRTDEKIKGTGKKRTETNENSPRVTKR